MLQFSLDVNAENFKLKLDVAGSGVLEGEVQDRRIRIEDRIQRADLRHSKRHLAQVQVGKIDPVVTR